MSETGLLRYVLSCGVLTVPILAWNVVFTRFLPPALTSAEFLAGYPAARGLRREPAARCGGGLAVSDASRGGDGGSTSRCAAVRGGNGPLLRVVGPAHDPSTVAVEHQLARVSCTGVHTAHMAPRPRSHGPQAVRAVGAQVVGVRWGG